MRPSAPLSLLLVVALTACTAAPNQSGADGAATAASVATPAAGGQSTVKDDQSQQDVVKIAVGSKDHTTLVTALQAADLVNSLSNAGPFTVFAPTNAAFEKLPAGTVEGLLKPDKKSALADILQHHVTVPVFDSTALTDGLSLSMADGGSVKVSRRGPDTYVGDAKILGAVRGSNGIVYVIDGVLLPGK